LLPSTFRVPFPPAPLPSSRKLRGSPRFFFPLPHVNVSADGSFVSSLSPSFSSLFFEGTLQSFDKDMFPWLFPHPMVPWLSIRPGLLPSTPFRHRATVVPLKSHPLSPLGPPCFASIHKLPPLSPQLISSSRLPGSFFFFFFCESHDMPLSSLSLRVAFLLICWKGPLLERSLRRSPTLSSGRLIFTDTFPSSS